MAPANKAAPSLDPFSQDILVESPTRLSERFLAFNRQHSALKRLTPGHFSFTISGLDVELISAHTIRLYADYNVALATRDPPPSLAPAYYANFAELMNRCDDSGYGWAYLNESRTIEWQDEWTLADPESFMVLDREITDRFLAAGEVAVTQLYFDNAERLMLLDLRRENKYFKMRVGKREREDEEAAAQSRIMDATQTSDGAHVMLKISHVDEYPDEVPIAEFFSSTALVADPRNHCGPIYELLHPDLNDIVIMVMPLLYDLQCPKFDTIGEAVESFRQTFEACNYLYELIRPSSNFNKGPSASAVCNLSHRFKQWLQMAGCFGLAPNTQDAHSAKYFIINYNLSSRYTDAGPHLELGGWDGDRTVPEFRAGQPEMCDPFAVDVYCLGNSIREFFIEVGLKCFNFMKELLPRYVLGGPKARPTMNEVVSRFATIQLGLSELKLRSRVAARNEFLVVALFRSANYWIWHLVLICTLRRLPNFTRRKRKMA
ncbi:hypothetical protein B0H17DRAFT_1128337 [Mycena rosella]|uniref:Uncharacterized protein n=1 Tax=Mycena rosella TaxID=1033263 RepID=A0AAD7DZE2_MYCRO|nr:hypothetical protein B0H17DRAFT_1128337 [Mycena rosella]